MSPHPKQIFYASGWLQDSIEDFIKLYVKNNRIKNHPRYTGIEPELSTLVSEGTIEVCWSFKEHKNQNDRDRIFGSEFFSIQEALRIFVLQS